jgi:hypothetical protein
MTTIPTIQQLSAGKAAGKTNVIVLGHGGQVSIPVYVAGVKHAIANPDKTFKRGLTGFWPVTGAEVAQQFRASVHDRINQRGGLVVRSVDESRLNALKKAHLPNSECRWCGFDLGEYLPDRNKCFCDPSCRKDYYS